MKTDVKTDRNIRIVLAGVPNVGKSTVFNALTGMKQHTGNWTGKTVECAFGNFTFDGVFFSVTDLPGTYSLYAHSAEEVVARDCIVNDSGDIVLVVCDASCPERSLPLVLQILEVTSKVALFFNLADEGERCKVFIDAEKMASLLGVPVAVGTAKSKKDIAAIKKMCIGTVLEESGCGFITPYLPETEKVIKELEEKGEKRYKAAEILYKDPESFGLEKDKTRDGMASAFIRACDNICKEAITRNGVYPSRRDSVLDKIFTGKYTAFPLMSFLLIVIFWLTVKGANYPSALLWELFGSLGALFERFLSAIDCPSVIISFLVEGVYRVTAWIVSVMLPPMAVFFPLFTLLEDLGYLPRVAFNLDRAFKHCGGCGKQALCMCMGLGCNAVGVTGCRIIDSGRERLIGILTNSMIPCNGRFPLILTLAVVYFGVGGSTLASSAVLFLVLCLSVAVTFLSSKILSVTVLRGKPSSFTLELPPFRIPRVWETLVRSVFDRTLFVLGRALTAAIPAGAIIWILSNINAGNTSILSHICTFLDPVGHVMGLDGVILCAFILGFPANETVLPIAVMAYLSGGVLPETDSVLFVSEVLFANGWTLTTAICTVVFSLFHWPCATTLLTVKKETGSIKWTLLSAIYPTLWGIFLCVAINYVSQGIGFLL